MERQQNPNTSRLEAEIDSKISMAYLYAIAAKTDAAQIRELFRESLAASTTEQTINSKPNNDESN